MATGFRFAFDADVSGYNRKVSGMKGQTQDAVNSMVKSFAALAPAISVGAIAAWVKEIARASVELEKFATIAGLTVEQMQVFEYMGARIGLSGQDMASAFQDMNDRVGDFVQTGGGPLLDFFEQIGPKLGLTIEQFKGLSSAEALGLFISRLEQANASQADFTFFMESISGQSTALLPLFRDQSALLKELLARYNELGLGIDEVSNKKLSDLDRKFNDIKDTINNELKKALVAVVDLWKGDLDGFLLWVEEWGIQLNLFFGKRIDAVISNVSRIYWAGVETFEALTKVGGAAIESIATLWKLGIQKMIKDIQDLPGWMTGPIGLIADRFTGIDEAIERNNQKLKDSGAFIKGYGAEYIASIGGIAKEFITKENQLTYFADATNDIYGERLKTLNGEGVTMDDLLGKTAAQNTATREVNESFVKVGDTIRTLPGSIDKSTRSTKDLKDSTTAVKDEWAEVDKALNDFFGDLDRKSKQVDPFEPLKSSVDGFLTKLDTLIAKLGDVGVASSQANAAASNVSNAVIDNALNGFFGDIDAASQSGNGGLSNGKSGGGSGGTWVSRLIPTDLFNYSDQQLLGMLRQLEYARSDFNRNNNQSVVDSFGDVSAYHSSFQRSIDNQVKEIVDALNVSLTLAGKEAITSSFSGSSSIMDDVLRRYTENINKSMQKSTASTNDLLRIISGQLG